MHKVNFIFITLEKLAVVGMLKVLYASALGLIDADTISHMLDSESIRRVNEMRTLIAVC